MRYIDSWSSRTDIMLWGVSVPIDIIVYVFVALIHETNH